MAGAIAERARVALRRDFRVINPREARIVLAEADGKPLTGLAPVAEQQGAYVARVLRARLAGGRPPPPFRYRNYGTVATIGQRAAVADFGWLELDGTLAWLM